MTNDASIARLAAARLAGTFGPDLPTQVEQELSADPLKQPERLGDLVSVASLLVSIASLAWTIWHDIKKDHATGSPTEQAKVLATELAGSAPPGLPPPQRALLLQVVAEETVSTAG